MRYFKNKIPVFFRGDSTLLDEEHRLKTLFRRTALRWVYRFIDLAFYVGEANKAYFIKHGLQEDQLIRAPHAVDGQRFETISPTAQEKVTNWRLSLGIREEDFVVLFVGKLEEKKNPWFVVELAKRLNQDGIKFLVVGNGPLEESLKKEARNLPVIFLGFQNQSKMPGVYRLGNVLLLPSKGPGETWGLAANEAMHCGLPVLLSHKVGAATDLLSGEDCGLAFGVDELETVANYIRQLATDPEKYAAAGKKAREQVKKFSLEAVATAIETTLLKTAQREHAPG